MRKHKIIAVFFVLAIAGAVLVSCKKSRSTNDISTAEETQKTTDVNETTTTSGGTQTSDRIIHDTEEWREQELNGMGKYYYPEFELTYKEIDGVRHKCLIDEDGNYIILIGSEWVDKYAMSLFKIGTNENEAEVKWKYELGSSYGPSVMKCQLNDEGVDELILKGEITGGGDVCTFVYVFDTDNMREIAVGQNGDLRSEFDEILELPEGYSSGRVINVYVENSKMFAVISIDKINENAIQNDTEKYYSVLLEYDSETNRLKLHEEGKYISCEQYERLIIGDTEEFLEAYSTYAEYIEEKYADVIDENDPGIEEYRQRIKDCEDAYDRARAFGEYAGYLEMLALTH